MMKAKAVPGRFWGEAVHTAVYLLNRSPTKALDGVTPYEAWHGKQPAVHHLRTFGCVGHVKDTRPHLKKLDDRSTPMVFLGYADGSKAYRLFDPVGGRVHVSRDVVFDENASWSWDATSTSGAGGEPFTVEYMIPPVESGEPEHTSFVPASAVPRTASPAASPPVPAMPIPLEPPSPQDGIEFATPPSVDDALDADVDDDDPQ
jgi:hypothetical protein